MVNSMSCILAQAGQRVAGKPYTVSEYNHPFPNQYGAEGQPMLRAYGALQDWDGVFEYTYNHSPDFEPRRNTYFFSMIARTEVLAHFPACAAIYLRGDVREARQTVTGALAFSDYFDRLVGDGAVAAGITAAGLDGGLALVHKTAMDFSGKSGTDAAAVAQTDARSWRATPASWSELGAPASLPDRQHPEHEALQRLPEGRRSPGACRLRLSATPRLGHGLTTSRRVRRASRSAWRRRRSAAAPPA